MGICGGLAQELTTEHVIHEASTVAEAIELLDNNDVDVAILDLRLVDESGLEVARYISDNGINTRSIVLTSHASDRTMVAAYDAKVAAFIEKSTEFGPLLDAIMDTSTNTFVADAADAANGLKVAGAFNPDVLTPRQNEIANLAAWGMTDGELAEHIFVSEKTVRNTLSEIYRKLNVANRTQLAVLVNDYKSELPSL
jgi:DNA-binding NarL/FixJ family response regulator